ncbi:hypothetical protein GQ53DRAFT_749797 [Thozetella sp. PMI_491]|nr:hypothetical protein GQ53DRAFT_749797 [Thozetella sp. PMI_491]
MFWPHVCTGLALAGAAFALPGAGDSNSPVFCDQSNPDSIACAVDGSKCNASDLSSILPPTPTGALGSAITSYLNREPDCTACSNGLDPCSITTTLGPSLASEYSVFGSACSSWVTASSSAIIDLAMRCPELMQDSPEQFRLDLFVAGRYASCFGAVITDSPQGPSTAISSPTTGATDGTTAPQTSQPTPTPGTSSPGSSAPAGTGAPQSAAPARWRTPGPGGWGVWALLCLALMRTW